MQLKNMYITIKNNIVKKYMIRPSVHPFCFGPKLWDCVNSILSGLSDILTSKEKENMKNYLISLELLLPCNECRTSYSIYNKETDTNVYDIKNYETLNSVIELIYSLRVKVNNKIGMDYGVTLKYFETKILSIRNLCEINMDHVMCTMYNAPFISDRMIDKVIKYVYDHENKDISHIKNDKNDIKGFMCNLEISSVNFENELFKKMYNRNKKCLKLRDKIYSRMLTSNYNYIKSFTHDYTLYIELFKECCFLFNDKLLNELLDI